MTTEPSVAASATFAKARFNVTWLEERGGDDLFHTTKLNVCGFENYEDAQARFMRCTAEQYPVLSIIIERRYPPEYKAFTTVVRSNALPPRADMQDRMP